MQENHHDEDKGSEVRPNLSCNQGLNSAEIPASSFDTQLNNEQSHCNGVEDVDEEDVVEIEFEL